MCFWFEGRLSDQGRSALHREYPIEVLSNVKSLVKNWSSSNFWNYWSWWWFMYYEFYASWHCKTLCQLVKALVKINLKAVFKSIVKRVFGMIFMLYQNFKTYVHKNDWQNVKSLAKIDLQAASDVHFEKFKTMYPLRYILSKIYLQTSSIAIDLVDGWCSMIFLP